MVPPPSRYEPNLSLERIHIDPENERRSYNPFEFFALQRSIQRRGLITPIGVEELVDGPYQVVYGNRRTLAAKSVGLDTIKATIYKDLSEEQRYQMQVAENATKEQIPLGEIAEDLWEYYKFIVQEETQGRISLQEMNRAPYFWLLNESTRREFPLAYFARQVGMSEQKIADAFQYTNLHTEIKQRVSQGSLSYSFALELGRIRNRNEQRRFLAAIERGQREKYNPDKVVNAKQLRTKVIRYLEERKAERGEAPFSLSTPNKRNGRNYLQLERNFTGLVPFLGNLQALFSIDPVLAQGKFHLGTTRAAFEQHEEKVVSLEEALQHQPYYEEIVRQMERRAVSVRDRILAGEFDSLEGKTNDSISAVEYKIIPLERIHPDPNQPRKTFNQGRLRELAESIAIVGILQPFLVKPMDGGEWYRLIVGHRRTAAAKMKDITHLEEVGVLVCNASDELCRQIQYEEDIFERVVLSERAEKLHNLYQLERRKDPDLTIRQFAQQHSSLGTMAVINGIIFAGLPENVKTMHERGLLHYSTAVALAQEWKRYERTKRERNEQPLPEEEWITDWAVKAGLLEYGGRKLRKEVTTELHQRNLFSLLDQDKLQGRQHFIARRVWESLGVIPETERIVKSNGELPSPIVRAGVSFTREFKATQQLLG